MTCNVTPFYPIEMRFHCKHCFCDKNAFKALNAAFKFLLLLKIGVTYVIILLKKVKNIFTMNFLQLRCSNVLLPLKYKFLLCEPRIKFKKLPVAKALATDLVKAAY